MHLLKEYLILFLKTNASLLIIKNMNYIEYSFQVPSVAVSEILVAELAEVGFDSFQDVDNLLKAYIEKELWTKDILDDIYILKNSQKKIPYTFKEIEQINWNTQWEKNFSPIVVEGLCTIRATFHPKANTKYEIVIDPKMSFGTGHHQTTYLMVKSIMEEDLKDKKILDMGCGTGILAIASAKKGARDIDAIDIDQWCVDNSLENIAINGFEFIKVKKGNAKSIENKLYDLILANINRNILLEDIPHYAKHLAEKGILMISGFYSQDLDCLTKKCEENGLEMVKHQVMDNWVVAQYLKTKQ